MAPNPRPDRSEPRGTAVEVGLGALGVATHPEYLVTKAWALVSESYSGTPC